MEGANDRSKYMCFMINRYNLWGSNERSGPLETNVSASEALSVFFFFFETTFINLQIKGSSEGTETCLIKVGTVKVYLLL